MQTQALPITRTGLIPSSIMVREALCGSTERGPTNVTVFWKLELIKIKFSMQLCRQTVEALLDLEENLKNTFIVEGSNVKWIRLDPAVVPISEYNIETTDDWKGMVKEELRKPFNNPDAPAWRVAIGFPADSNKSILVAMSFFHACGDGVCFARKAVHFNEVMARISLNMDMPEPFSQEIVPLEILYETYPNANVDTLPEVLPQEFHPCQTGFAIHKFKDSDLLTAIKRYCKEHEIKVHSVLAASLVLAMKEVVDPLPFETLDVLSIVSFRNALKVSNDYFEPLFSWLAVNDVTPNCSFEEIAQRIHTDLHSQMDSGDHVKNLRATELQLAGQATAADLFRRILIPKNLVNVTNRGELVTSGFYPEGSENAVIEMTEIYGVGGNSPYFGLQGEEGKGLTVGITTVFGNLFTSASCLEDESIGLGEDKAEKVLKKMEEILLKEMGLD